MEVDEDEQFFSSARRVRRKEDVFGDDDDVIEQEYDVVVCDSLPNTELYCVAFPTRKKNTWDAERETRARYKKNVRVLEVRMNPDETGSYDHKKAEALGGGSGGKFKQESGRSHHEDVYEGRAFQNDNPLCNAVGYLTNGKFFLHPVAGTFEMHRSIANMNKKGGGKDDDGDLTEESDSEAPPAGGQLRVKFSRPETERQKKRREASALHREKKIASDAWINMEVHLKDTKIINDKLRAMSVRASNGSLVDGAEGVDRKMGLNEQGGAVEVRQLVNSAILCGKKEELVIESGKEHMLSRQRIRELAPGLQVKAHMVKAHSLKTSEMRSLVDVDDVTMLSQLAECARLVQGVWVLQSDLLFQNLPPAHSNVHGRVDEYRSELWRSARDLALCLLDAGHRVTRNTLTSCFRLGARDAEEVLSTFGVRDETTRSWRLRIEKDDEFLNNPANRNIVLEQKKYWVERWNELQKQMNKSTSKERTQKKK